MHWYPSDLNMLLNKIVSFGIARLVSSLNHLKRNWVKLFSFMFYHFDEYVSNIEDPDGRWEWLYLPHFLGKQQTWGCHAQECTICTETPFCFGTKWTKRPPEKDFKRLYQGTIRTCYKKIYGIKDDLNYGNKSHLSFGSWFKGLRHHKWASLDLWQHTCLWDLPKFVPLKFVLTAHWLNLGCDQADTASASSLSLV